MTHPARTSAVSAIAAILRGAGLADAFLLRETAPGVVELVHDARRESTLHIRTDLFEAKKALERAGFEPFEVGSSILVSKRAAPEPKPSLAKGTQATLGDDNGEEDTGSDGHTRVA